jgi:hypothetical protein
MTVGFVLALFISSATARVGTVIPIMVGITMPHRLPAASSLAATLMTCPPGLLNLQHGGQDRRTAEPDQPEFDRGYLRPHVVFAWLPGDATCR